MRSWPSARHEQAQWLGTDKARAARGRKKGAPRVAALRATGLGTKPSKEICWRCNANCSEILWTGRTQDVVNFLYVCLHLCACVCSSVLRVHVQLCVVSPAGPGLFRAQSRSGRIAELWKRIKLRHKTFPTLTWEVIRVDQTPPKLRAKGAETRHMVGALRLRTGDGLPQAPAVSSQPHSPWTLRAAARLLHDHVCGAVRQCCVRQVLSPVLQLPQGFVQGCLQRQLVGAEAEDAQWPRRCVRCSPSCYPREYWTCRDESFMGVVLSMAHSRVGSGVLDTYRALSR